MLTSIPSHIFNPILVCLFSLDYLHLESRVTLYIAIYLIPINPIYSIFLLRYI